MSRTNKRESHLMFVLPKNAKKFYLLSLLVFPVLIFVSDVFGVYLFKKILPGILTDNHYIFIFIFSFISCYLIAVTSAYFAIKRESKAP